MIWSNLRMQKNLTINQPNIINEGSEIQWQINQTCVPFISIVQINWTVWLISRERERKKWENSNSFIGNSITKRVCSSLWLSASNYYLPPTPSLPPSASPPTKTLNTPSARILCSLTSNKLPCHYACLLQTHITKALRITQTHRLIASST